MEITENETQINVKFASERRYEIYIDNKSKSIILQSDVELEKINDVKTLRKYSSEIAQIATLIKDQLNMVHGYEFNEDVEKPEPEQPESEEDKLRKVYFGFYDKMDEPERSQAKANWNYREGDLIVNSIADSIICGFVWEDTPEEHEYWDKIHRKYNA